MNFVKLRLQQKGEEYRMCKILWFLRAYMSFVIILVFLVSIIKWIFGQLLLLWTILNMNRTCNVFLCWYFILVRVYRSLLESACMCAYTCLPVCPLTAFADPFESNLTDVLEVNFYRLWIEDREPTTALQKGKHCRMLGVQMEEVPGGFHLSERNA